MKTPPVVTARDWEAARQQLLLQPVFPGGRRCGDLRFDAVDVIHRPRAGLGVDQQVQARQRRIGDLHLGLDVAGAKTGPHDALDALAHFGVVAVARHVHDAGIETFVAVTAHEQPHATTLI